MDHYNPFIYSENLKVILKTRHLFYETTEKMLGSDFDGFCINLFVILRFKILAIVVSSDYKYVSYKPCIRYQASNYCVQVAVICMILRFKMLTIGISSMANMEILHGRLYNFLDIFFQVLSKLKRQQSHNLLNAIKSVEIKN